VFPEEPPMKRHMQNFDLNDAYVEEDEVHYLG
jgi:hypothetical protein